jgi:hypothetical protein
MVAELRESKPTQTKTRSPKSRIFCLYRLIQFLRIPNSRGVARHLFLTAYHLAVCVAAYRSTVFIGVYSAFWPT